MVTVLRLQYNLVAASLHQQRLIQIGDGYIFDVLKKWLQFYY